MSCGSKSLDLNYDKIYRNQFFTICIRAGIVILGLMTCLGLVFGHYSNVIINAVTLVLLIFCRTIFPKSKKLDFPALMFCGVVYANTIVIHAVTPSFCVRGYLFMPITLAISLALLKVRVARNLSLVAFAIMIFTDFFVRSTQGTVPVGQEMTAFFVNLVIMFIGIAAIIATLSSVFYRYRKLQEKFQAQVKKSTELVSSRSALLSLVMLDLKIPLEKIKIELEKLEDFEMSEEDQRKYNKMTANSGRIDRLLENVKMIRDASGETLGVKLCPVSIRDSIEEAIDVLADKAIEKNIKFVINWNSIEDVFVQADRTSMCLQVFQNLFSNAIKFSSSGGSIFIEIRVDDRDVAISIRDEGIGMPPRIRDSIFDVNVATTRVGTSGEKGTGFGMPIVKNFMDAFNAEIEVSSDEGSDHGTTFLLRFSFVDEPSKQAA